MCCPQPECRSDSFLLISCGINLLQFLSRTEGEFNLNVEINVELRRSFKFKKLHPGKIKIMGGNMTSIKKLFMLPLIVAVFLSLSISVVHAGPLLLKKGMSGDAVLNLQASLQKAGYYNGEMDGIFGPVTESAVFNFQSDKSLDVDGIVGPATLKTLQEPYSTPPPITSRAASLDRKGEAVVTLAKQFLGTGYVWGGSSPDGFDCSGFTTYLFDQFGIGLPRMADGQFNEGVPVSQPRPGDLVFFTTYEPGPSHVGIYIGNDQFIHCSSAAGAVIITSLSGPYYESRYLGARRMLD